MKEINDPVDTVLFEDFYALGFSDAMCAMKGDWSPIYESAYFLLYSPHDGIKKAYRNGRLAGFRSVFNSVLVK